MANKSNRTDGDDLDCGITMFAPSTANHIAYGNIRGYNIKLRSGNRDIFHRWLVCHGRNVWLSPTFYSTSIVPYLIFDTSAYLIIVNSMKFCRNKFCIFILCIFSWLIIYVPKKTHRQFSEDFESKKIHQDSR